MNDLLRARARIVQHSISHFATAIAVATAAVAAHHFQIEREIIARARQREILLLFTLGNETVVVSIFIIIPLRLMIRRLIWYR